MWGGKGSLVASNFWWLSHWRQAFFRDGTEKGSLDKGNNAANYFSSFVGWPFHNR
jgi:hypothetical protein